MGLILAVLKHSLKIPSDSELLKSIETVGEISITILMLWKSVGNWQQRRTVDLLELECPVFSKPENYSDEQAAETIHYDWGT